MSADRKLGASLLLLAALTVAFAQKDGKPAATAGVAPPLAKDGVPATVDIPAGSFVMGAESAPLARLHHQGLRRHVAPPRPRRL